MAVQAMGPHTAPLGMVGRDLVGSPMTLGWPVGCPCKQRWLLAIHRSIHSLAAGVASRHGIAC